MEYKRMGDTVAVRLDPGDEIVKSLETVAKNEHITAGMVEGIGAVEDLAVGVFDLAEKTYRNFEYRGNHEINALMGNITEKDGAPYLHLHITCTAGDGCVVGGHLLRAVISLTGEIFIRVLPATATRKYYGQIGINQIIFE